MSLRIVAWNIRSGGGRRIEHIVAQLRAWQPTVIALSEYRTTDPGIRLAELLAASGWVHQKHPDGRQQQRQNGVFIASRYPLRRIRHVDAPQEPARWLLTWVYAPVRFRLAAMHIPNQITGRKPDYHQGVLAMAARYQKEPGIFIGDTNSGKIGKDEQRPVFNQQTDQWFDKLRALGWYDTYRELNGAEEAYSWYSPNGGNGFRLDQAFCNRSMQQRVTGISYQWGYESGKSDQIGRRDALSDHAAVILDLNLEPA